MRIILSICCLVFLSSCHKNDQPAGEFGQNAYPLAVGNWWRYKVTDLDEPVDTLLLSIISKSVNGSTKDYMCTIYKNSYARVVDTGHFILSDTSLYYNSSNPYYSYFGYFNLKLPFMKGQVWPGIFPKDSFTAVGMVSSLKISSHTYGPVYSLRREVFIPHYSNIQVLFVTPGVGIIDQSIDIQIDTATPQEQDFQLIDYKLN